MKKLIQVQRPMVFVLTACALPALVGLYNFGWRVLFVLLVCNAACWGTEYLFLRKSGKTVTLAALVTGTLLALTLPPGVPFWMAILGSVISITFGKMVFGGFGKNIFNPALVGRCFLYIAFPAALAATWPAPFTTSGGGLTKWSADPALQPAAEVILPQGTHLDGVTGATLLTATKKLNQHAGRAKQTIYLAPENLDLTEANETLKAANGVIASIDGMKSFTGHESGSIGETSALALLIGLGYLLYRKVVKVSLVFGPLAGLVLTTILLRAVGVIELPLSTALLVNLLGGGTLFACILMTTEPVSAPQDDRARWIYGVAVGILATIIQYLSAFNAGFMFAILLGNMFSPLLDLCLTEYDTWKRERCS